MCALPPQPQLRSLTSAGRGWRGLLFWTEQRWSINLRHVYTLEGWGFEWAQGMCRGCWGRRQACAVSTQGELYTWGRGYGGRLGHGDQAEQLEQKRVEALRDVWVVAVSLGMYHYITVTRDGGVFGWGAAERLSLPEAATVVVVEGGDDDEEEKSESTLCLSFSFPHLPCILRS